MKSKHLGSILAMAIIAFQLSCSPTASTPTNTNTSTNWVIDRLTKNVWIYDTIYSNYGQANQTILYARGAVNNNQDWSKSRVKFYRDNSFDEVLINGTLRQPSVWSMSSDSATLYTNGGGFNNKATLLSLTENKLEWFDSTTLVKGIQIAKK